MKNNYLRIAALSAVIATPFFTTGCDKTISKDEKSTTHSDGSTTTKEKTVTQDSDGTVKKTEETKETAPTR
jgi:hypothetical protein